MTSVAVYVLGYSMELSSLDLSSMLFWSEIEYLGIYSFPTLFLLFVLQYTGQNKWFTLRNFLILFFIPTLLLIVKLTDDTFHLVYSTAWVDTSGLIPLLGFTRGPIYPFALYACIPVITGIVLLWQKRNNTPPLYRKQATLIIVAATLPLVIFVFYMTGIQPFPNLKYLDLNPFMSTFWGIGIGWAAFRYQLLELAPIARDVLVEYLGDGLFVFDEQTRLVDANPVAANHMGWAPPPIGQFAEQVFATWKDLRDVFQATIQTEPVKLEIQYDIGDKSLFFETTIHGLQDKKGGYIGRLIVIHDITDRKQLEDELRELSLEDELTGLGNRRGFNILAAQFIQMIKRMDLQAGFIFADLDGLKTINDTFGHAEGDQALVDMADMLRSTFRSSDIVARLGGDEFMVLSMESKDNLAEAMLSRLKSRLDEFNAQAGRKYQISASFGIAHFCSNCPLSLDDLVQAADKAMYAEKQAKKIEKDGLD
jgi:diguanylate cyclase (GGDEF)-like protein/PAS domain S-box-containing protein